MNGAHAARMVLSLIATGFVSTAGCGPAMPSQPSQSVAELVRERADAAAIAECGRVVFVRGVETGLPLAKELDAPALLFFTASWCSFCHQMESTTFAADGPRSLSKRFVCILVDADEAVDVCRRYQVEYFPTIVFLSASGSPLERLVGRQSAAELLRAMHLALDRLAWRKTGLTVVR